MSQPATPTVSDRVKAGASLGVDGSIKSPNGDYAFVLQGDGNCCAYAPGGRPIWCSNTWGWPKPVTCVLETDGNLRLLDHHGNERWSSGSGGQGTADSELIIQDDGNVVISTDGKFFWSTNTTQAPLPTPADTPANPSSPTTKPTVPPPAPTPTDRLNPGGSLNINQTLVSSNGNYTLIMQPDTNCVLYQKGKGPLWSAGMGPGNTAQCLLFRADGELEILTGFGDPKWQAGTAGRGNSTSYFQVRDDGNMVIWTDSQIVWSSRTGPAYPMPVKDNIVGGQRILPGELLTSANGSYTLTLGNDLNLVLAQGSTTTWSSGAQDSESPDGWVQVDATGNMAIVAGFDAQWSSHTTFRRTPGICVLKLGNDGVVDLTLDNTVIWSTDASRVRLYVPPDFIAVTSGNTLLPGQYLAAGQSITSPSGKMTATVSSSGQFIIQNVPTSTTLFTSNTPPNLTPSMLTVGYNNDVILWSTSTSKIWEATVNTNLRDNIFAQPVPGSLVLSDLGDLSLHDINWPSETIWRSNTSCPAFNGAVSELNSGETLLVGQKMQSPNGVHEITFLASGGLQLSNTALNTSVIYEPIPLTGSNAHYFTFGRDMVLEISDVNGNSLWRSSNRHPALNTTYAPPGPDGLPQLNGDPGLILDNDCNIFVRNGDGKILWKISDIIASIGDSLTPGQTLDKAHSICSTTGGYVARISSKGNLVLLHKKPWDEFEPEVLMWTAGATNADSVWMSSDGSLCVGSGGTATWTSNTGGHAGESGIVLYVQPDGNMCIYVAGKPTFSTNTAH